MCQKRATNLGIASAAGASLFTGCLSFRFEFQVVRDFQDVQDFQVVRDFWLSDGLIEFVVG